MRQKYLDYLGSSQACSCACSLAHSIAILSSKVGLARLGTMFYHPWCAAAHTCCSWASLAKVPPSAFPACHFPTVLRVFPDRRSSQISEFFRYFSDLSSNQNRPFQCPFFSPKSFLLYRNQFWAPFLFCGSCSLASPFCICRNNM